MWGPIILALFNIFGPMLAEVIKKLLDKWFSRAAAMLPATMTAFGNSEASAKLALLEKTLEILPRYAVIRRQIVHQMIQAVKADEVTAEQSRAVSELLDAAVSELLDAADWE